MSGTEAPIIQLKNIGKNHGNINALRGVNLTVRQGEVHLYSRGQRSRQVDADLNHRRTVSA
jgi:ABC-type histidine transport system ATPase subunit